MAWYMLWPGGHDMVYGMVCRAWHGILYGLEGIAVYMVWPGGHGMVYGITWRGMGWYMAWPGGMKCTWYGLAGMALYMVWSSGHGMACWAPHGIVLAWQIVEWYMLLSSGI